MVCELYLNKAATLLLFLGHTACLVCRILVPRPEIEPRSIAVKAPSLNHWTGNSLGQIISYWLLFQKRGVIGIKFFSIVWKEERDTIFIFKKFLFESSCFTSVVLVSTVQKVKQLYVCVSVCVSCNPFQYPWLENPMDRGVWQATVHWVTKSQTRLND